MVIIGRIQHYGISSNSFPVNSTDPQFVSLERIVQQLGSSAPNFYAVQYPYNLFECGALLNLNQTSIDQPTSLIDFAKVLRLHSLNNTDS